MTVGDHTLSAKSTSMRSPSFATTRDHGQTFAGAVEALLPSAYDPLAYSIGNSSHQLFQRRLSLRPKAWRWLGMYTSVTGAGICMACFGACNCSAARRGTTLSRVSYSSDYMARKPADTPSLPWYGFSDGMSNERYGVWSRGTSKLMSHEGHLLTFQGQGACSECSTCVQDPLNGA